MEFDVDTSKSVVLLERMCIAANSTVTQKWHTKPAKPPPVTNASHPRSAELTELDTGLFK